MAQSALLRILGVFGHTLRRLAEAQRDLFRIAVEDPLKGLPDLVAFAWRPW